MVRYNDVCLLIATIEWDKQVSTKGINVHHLYDKAC
jgi:hypothetical protein